MATLSLINGDSLWTIPAGGVMTNVLGTNGVDKIAVATGAKVNFNSSFNAGVDNIYIQSDSSNFTVKNSGATVTLTDADGNNIVIPAGPTGQKLIFGDGFLNLQIAGGALKLGGQTIGTTAIGVTAVVDTTITSDAQFVVGGTTLPPSYVPTPIDVGTTTTPVQLDAATGSFNYTDNAVVATNVVINHFTNNDKITISNATSESYAFSNDGADVSISFNNAGTMNTIKLTGVVNSSLALVYDEASFEYHIGFNAFGLA